MRAGSFIVLTCCFQTLAFEAITPRADESPRSEVTLRVYNYSWATENELVQTKVTAAQILGRAGVALRWIQCSPVPESSALLVECGLPLRLGSFQVLIKENADGSRTHALAATAPGSSILAVFYRNSRDLAQIGDLPTGLVLGRALIHELGHNVFGEQHHATTGIMKARFGPDDFYDMRRGWLVFTPQQSRLLQKFTRRPRSATAPDALMFSKFKAPR